MTSNAASADLASPARELGSPVPSNAGSLQPMLPATTSTKAPQQIEPYPAASNVGLLTSLSPDATSSPRTAQTSSEQKLQPGPTAVNTKLTASKDSPASRQVSTGQAATVRAASNSSSASQEAHLHTNTSAISRTTSPTNHSRSPSTTAAPSLPSEWSSEVMHQRSGKLLKKLSKLAAAGGLHIEACMRSRTLTALKARSLPTSQKALKPRAFNDTRLSPEDLLDAFSSWARWCSKIRMSTFPIIGALVFTFLHDAVEPSARARHLEALELYRKATSSHFASLKWPTSMPDSGIKLGESERITYQAVAEQALWPLTAWSALAELIEASKQGRAESDADPTDADLAYEASPAATARSMTGPAASVTPSVASPSSQLSTPKPAVSAPAPTVRTKPSVVAPMAPPPVPLSKRDAPLPSSSQIRARPAITQQANVKKHASSAASSTRPTKRQRLAQNHPSLLPPFVVPLIGLSDAERVQELEFGRALQGLQTAFRHLDKTRPAVVVASTSTSSGGSGGPGGTTSATQPTWHQREAPFQSYTPAPEWNRGLVTTAPAIVPLAFLAIPQPVVTALPVLNPPTRTSFAPSLRQMLSYPDALKPLSPPVIKALWKAGAAKPLELPPEELQESIRTRLKAARCWMPTKVLSPAEQRARAAAREAKQRAEGDLANARAAAASRVPPLPSAVSAAPNPATTAPLPPPTALGLALSSLSNVNVQDRAGAHDVKKPTALSKPLPQAPPLQPSSQASDATTRPRRPSMTRASTTSSNVHPLAQLYASGTVRERQNARERVLEVMNRFSPRAGSVPLASPQLPASVPLATSNSQPGSARPAVPPPRSSTPLMSVHESSSSASNIAGEQSVQDTIAPQAASRSGASSLTRSLAPQDKASQLEKIELSAAAEGTLGKESASSATAVVSPMPMPDAVGHAAAVQPSRTKRTPPPPPPPPAIVSQTSWERRRKILRIPPAWKAANRPLRPFG